MPTPLSSFSLMLAFSLLAIPIASHASSVEKKQEASTPTSPPAPETTLNQTKARVFIYRTSSSLILGGVSASYGGRRVASLSDKEFDVAELPTGEIEIEVGQNLSADLCRVKIAIEPGKDNFLKIRDRDVGVGRRFIFNSPLIQLLDRSTSGACGGLNEIIKVSNQEGAEESKEYVYSPLRDLSDKSLAPSALCSALNAGSDSSCKVTHGQISMIRPVRYVADASAPGFVKPPELQIQCQVGANPLLTVTVDACLKIKGQIIGRESLRCALAGNPPISLDPELCISGGGSVVQ